MTMSRRGFLLCAAAAVRETRWRDAGTPEASTRHCRAAMSRQVREAGAL